MEFTAEEKDEAQPVCETDASAATSNEPEEDVAFDDSTSESFAALVNAHPDAPKHRLRRFARCRAKPEDALDMFAKEREWRRTAGSREEILRLARSVPDQQPAPAPRALETGNAIRGPQRAPVRQRREAVVRWARGGSFRERRVLRLVALTAAFRDRLLRFCTMSPNRTARGDYVLLIEGARYDPAVSAEAHVALLVLRVEESISDDAECDAHARILVLVDVRPNAGWINAPGARLIPFVRKIAATIPPYYPERLRSLAVYPVPWLLVWVFTACTGTFLDKRTRAKVSMLAGPNYADSPCPVELADIATYEVIPIHCRQRYEALRIPAA